MSFEADQGLSTSYWSQPYDWQGPWHRALFKGERRHSPKFGGGRRMRHPYLDPIVYPRNPDKTMGMDFDRMLKTKSLVTKTLSSSVVTKFRDVPEDVIITEMWQADTLSTETGFFRRFHRYLTEVLPVGEYIGWQPKDLTWKNYFIELLDVKLGNVDDYLVEELGDERAYMMREQLTVSFKLVKEIIPPVSAIAITGA